MTSVLKVDTLQNLNSSTIITQTNATTLTLGTSGQTISIPAGATINTSTINVTTVVLAAGAVGTPSLTTSGDTNTGIFFPSADTIAFTEGGTEAMRITSDGRLGIGTTSPTQLLTLSGGSTPTLSIKDTRTPVEMVVNAAEFSGDSGTITNHPYLFKTNSTERMRITADGFVAINSNFASVPLKVAGTGTGGIILCDNTAVTGNVGTFFSVLNNNGNNTNSFHFVGLTQGVAFFYLFGNGTTSFTSDKRQKKNIETTRDGYIDDLCKLRVVKYNWKIDEDNKPKELGLIAQEVEQIFPGLIQDSLHEDKEGNKHKIFKGSVLPFMLLKGIQELKVIIDTQNSKINSLEARLTALES